MPKMYHHHPLEYNPDGRPKQFRILRILGGPRGSPLKCEVLHYDLPWDLKDDPTVKYEALSWTWGEEATLDYILTSERHFAIKSNLGHALEYLRDDTMPRNLWVDFVCIDQGNFVERASQVQLMPFIYSKAFNVCIWLGNESHNSTFAVDFVKNQVNDLGGWIRSTEERNKDKWAALAALMDRPWFSRRWIVQELAFAKRATVHCANDWMYWTEFETAVALFERDAQRLSDYYKSSKETSLEHDFFADVAQMGACRLVHLKRNLFRLNTEGRIAELRASLTDLVFDLWSFEAQEPHDFIYAILSIANDTYDRIDRFPRVHQPEEDSQTAIGQAKTAHERAEAVSRALRNAVDTRVKFHIDYTQDYVLVCKQFLRHVIPRTQKHNLDILLHPWSPFKDKTNRRISLPSWVPTMEQAAFKRQRAHHAPGGYRIVRANADPLVGQMTDGSRGSPYNASRTQTAAKSHWQLFPGSRIDEGQERSLIVTGFVLDKVDCLQDASQHSGIPGEWLVLGGWQDQYGFRQETTDALWRTLVADRGPDGTNIVSYYPKAFEQAVQNSEDGIDSTLLDARGHPVLSEFLGRMKAVVTKKRLFKGQRRGDLGHLGLAPKNAKNGDCKLKRPAKNFTQFL